MPTFNIGEVYLPYLFRFWHFQEWHFQKCHYQKKIFLIEFLDELGNFKQKKFYTFDFYTFKRGKVDRLRHKSFLLLWGILEPVY